MGRVIIVSNRLPITVQLSGDDVTVKRSTGGLATGLKAPHESSGGLWIGWSGLTEDLSPARDAQLARRFEELRVVPVPLTATEVERYYEGVCNGVIWPLFHYLVDQMPLAAGNFDYYERANARFCDAVVANYQPGDVIWVHDYQLMLLPAMLRKQLPDARIGFFLHIPWPSSEVFRTLPWRERLLQGLLGADLVGFHTAAYMRHFASSVLLVLGQPTEVDRIRWQRRTVRLGVFPMGVDAQRWDALTHDEPVQKLVEGFREGLDGQLMVGIDRLDYTKGIPRRLLAFRRMLRESPELRGHVRLVQVAVPSRQEVEAYGAFREQVDALVGAIHGEFATPTWVPIHYLFRGLSESEVVALYRAADVMLVTPIRDGMNLVAKEFVASRSDEGGVLVLSEFTGAATELAEALHVNPYDVERSARVYKRALTMEADERTTRMRALRRRVFTWDVHRWADGFLAQLKATKERTPTPQAISPHSDIQAAVDRMREAKHLVLLLDYDGTLVPFAETPELASPDQPLRELLRLLAARHGTVVHVVSGRTRETLDKWLGDLPVGIHAEHGYWTRLPGGEWTAQPVNDAAWRPAVLQILKDWVGRTPGSLVEEKTVGLAWHYRMADPTYGQLQANELKLHLTSVLANAPVEVLPGEKVIEVRPHGVNKGRVVTPVVDAAPRDALVVAFGDDRTDEDMFAALPGGALSIHVGPNASRAKLRVAEVGDVRDLLADVVAPD